MVVGGSSLGGQDASGLCGDAGDMPGSRKWELWGWGWSGVRERSRAECLLPSVPQTLYPARGWLFPQCVLSCISVQLWALRVGAGPGRGALVNTCQETGGSPQSLLVRIRLNPGPLHSLDLRPQGPNGLVQCVASRLVFVCLFPRGPQLEMNTEPLAVPSGGLV